MNTWTMPKYLRFLETIFSPMSLTGYLKQEKPARKNTFKNFVKNEK